MNSSCREMHFVVMCVLHLFIMCSILFLYSSVFVCPKIICALFRQSAFEASLHTRFCVSQIVFLNCGYQFSKSFKDNKFNHLSCMSCHLPVIMLMNVNFSSHAISNLSVYFENYFATVALEKVMLYLRFLDFSELEIGFHLNHMSLLLAVNT